MRAIILVGGFGTRLRPLTNEKPKQILNVGNKTMLENVIENLSNHKVTEVILSMGFQPSAFVDAYPNGMCGGLPLKYVVEPTPLDTAGAIGFSALESSVNETFLVCNGDVIAETDISELVDFHRDAGAEATISKESYGIRRCALEAHSERRNHTTASATRQPANKTPFCSVNRTAVLWCTGGVLAYVGSQRL